jgi:hypothetical protein
MAESRNIELKRYHRRIPIETFDVSVAMLAASDGLCTALPTEILSKLRRVMIKADDEMAIAADLRSVVTAKIMSLRWSSWRHRRRL